MISSHVKISMISLISSLSLKLRLIKFIGVLSKLLRVFLGSLQQSWEIFSKRSWVFISGPQNNNILGNFRKSSESGQKSSENHQKRPVNIIKSTLHIASKIWIFVLMARTSQGWAQRMSEILFLPLEHKIHIFSPPCTGSILYFSQISIETKLITGGWLRSLCSLQSPDSQEHFLFFVFTFHRYKK